MKVVLKEYLQKRDISLAKLSRMTKLCYKTLNVFSCDHTKHVSRELLDTICYALDCQLSDILIPEPPKNASQIKKN